LLHAGEEQPPDTATTVQTGDETTWLGDGLEGRVCAEEIPPVEEDKATAEQAAGHGGASPLARDSADDEDPSLGVRHGERKLQRLPKALPDTRPPLTAHHLSLATKAGREGLEKPKTARKATQAPMPRSSSAHHEHDLPLAVTAGRKVELDTGDVDQEQANTHALIKRLPIPHLLLC